MSDLDICLEYLTAVPAWYLATAVDDQPHVRPFSFACICNGKLLFCTATTKDVWSELQQNPRFEATSWWPGHGWLVLQARAGFDCKPDESVRRAGCDHLVSLGESYDGPNDPTLVFFTAENPRAWICNHDRRTELALPR